MKKLFYCITILLVPLFMAAQQTVALRKQKVNIECRDSIMKMLLPFAEKWRQDYNSRSSDQLSLFYAENSEFIYSNLDAYRGNEDYIAIFQKEKEIGGIVDSILILSMNLSCNKATLFIRYLDKVDRADKKNQILCVWQKIKDSWFIISDIEALKN
jgi:hypothetical protein